MRAAEMLSLKLLGWKDADIANRFNCSEDTVARSLNYASREGMTKRYEEQVLERLVPKAIEIYSRKLEAGDEFVAKDVIEKLFRIGDRLSKREQRAEEITLEAHLRSKRNNRRQEKVIDANYTVVSVRPSQSPAVEAEAEESIQERILEAPSQPTHEAAVDSGRGGNELSETETTSAAKS